MNPAPTGSDASGTSNASPGSNNNTSGDAITAFWNLIQAAANVQPHLGPVMPQVHTPYPGHFLAQDQYGFPNVPLPSYFRQIPPTGHHLMLPGFNGMQTFPQYMPGLPAQFQNLPAFNMFNLPMVPSQTSTDGTARTNVTPISPDDEDLLVQKLHASIGTGQLDSDVVETLHGVCNHTATQWKDHYMNNYKRIHDQISTISDTSQSNDPLAPEQAPLAGQNADPGSQPAGIPLSMESHSQCLRNPVAFESHPQPTGNSLASELHSQPAGILPASHTEASTSMHPLALPRHYLRSAHHRVLLPRFSNSNSKNSRHNATHAALHIPTPPSRSPTPPAPHPPKRTGNPRFANAYTDEDDSFYIRSIQWYLQQDHTLSRSVITGKIAKKAPHHSLDSWKSYYKRRANLVDTIFAKAQEYVNVIPTAEQGSKHVPAGSSPLTSSSNEDNDDSDSNLSSIPGDEPRTEDDARNMGETGGPYTDADLRIVAKFIASTSDWDERLRHEKWEPFQDKYPGRGYRSWAEFYRRQAPAIDRLVRKYKRRDQRNAAAKNATNPTIVEPAENQITMNPLKRKADLQPHGIDPSAVSAKRRHTAPNPGARQKPLNTSTGLTSQVASSKGKERAVEVEVDVIDLTILDEDFKEEDF
ncbi:hypothetical protein BKA93DRAFT_518439 [Sparassis latifolia]